MKEPANNRMDLTAPRGLAVARSATLPRAHSRTGAAGHAGRSTSLAGITCSRLSKTRYGG
jgi:hypothetical protein